MPAPSALFYQESSFGIFVLVTIVLGGGAAALAGRAVALTWRPWWQIVAYSLILGFAVRFIHFSLFGAPLLSWHYSLVDAAFCLGFAALGFRAARTALMARQYHWLFAPNGPLRWRRRPH